MIKMCAVSIVVPLTIIFNKDLTTSIYPDIWKRGKVVAQKRQQKFSEKLSTNKSSAYLLEDI